MKVKSMETMNWKAAIRGMRNPMNSHHLSDSKFGYVDWDTMWTWIEDIAKQYVNHKYYGEFGAAQRTWELYLYHNGVREVSHDVYKVDLIGPKDMRLLRNLTLSGPSDRKALRQIFVSLDITAPLFWWNEFDTYKIGTVANSTSKMHKIQAKPITMENFETTWDFPTEGYEILSQIVSHCEKLRLQYLYFKDKDKNKAKEVWKALITILPESWLYTRTVSFNYENVLSMINQREYHKLAEWRFFVSELHCLPYIDLILGEEEINLE